MVDSSVLVSVFVGEDDARAFERILASEAVVLPAPVLLEAHMVLKGRGGSEVEPFLTGLAAMPNVEVAPFALAE